MIVDQLILDKGRIQKKICRRQEIGAAGAQYRKGGKLAGDRYFRYTC